MNQTSNPLFESQTIDRLLESYVIYFYYLTKCKKCPRLFSLMKCNYAQLILLNLFSLSNNSQDITQKSPSRGFLEAG
jgi:hypothetical protein